MTEDTQRLAEELHSPYACVLGDVDAHTLRAIEGAMEEGEVVAGPEVPSDNEDASDLGKVQPSSAQASNRWAAYGLVEKARWRLYSLAGDNFVGTIHKAHDMLGC